MTNNVTAMANVAEAANNAAGTASDMAGWQTQFCDRYALLLLAYGRWFLLAALIIGTVGAAVVVYRTLVPAGEGEGGGANLTAIQTIIEALKGLVEAFAKAPTWLAMFGGGVLLVWMAGDAVPAYCTAAEVQTQRRSDGVRSPQRTPGNEIETNTAKG